MSTLQSICWHSGYAAGRPVLVTYINLHAVIPDSGPGLCRYKHLHGKHVLHPVNGRRLPIILDAELVDMSFGTGAVKITPAHDPNDFATGKRHNLEFINILDDDGNINEHGGQFAGRPRFEVQQNLDASAIAEEFDLLRKRSPLRLKSCRMSPILTSKALWHSSYMTSACCLLARQPHGSNTVQY